MSRATFDQIWGKLLEITSAIGDLKAEVATCASEIVTLAGHQADQNGNASEVLLRLEALELVNAEDCGEKKGARRQWVLISGALIAGAALATIATSVGFIMHWW